MTTPTLELPESKAGWIADCEHKVGHILARSYATKDEIDAMRPLRSARLKRWVQFYCQLVAVLGRAQHRVSLLEHAEADAQTVAALAAQPVRLRLTYPADNEVELHPKAFEPLAWFFKVRDDLLLFLADRVMALRERGAAEDLPLLERALAEMTYQAQLLCWAACTGDAKCGTAGIPFSFQDERPEIPAPFDRLAPIDVRRIHAAFLQVNVGALEAAELLLAPQRADAPKQRPSWSVFLGQMELKTHVASDRIMRDRPLGPMLLAVKLAAPPPPDETPRERKKKAEAA